MMVRLIGSFFILVVMASFGWIFMSRSGPESAQPQEGEKPERDVFAIDREGVAFDAKRAMGYLEEICKLGSRISASEGMKKQQELLKNHFEAKGNKVELQRFSVRQQSRRNETEMANLIISWHPERKRRVILCAHYDTRPIADQEPDPRKWREPFIGANDGASGVAFFMEMANQMKDLKTQVGVDFVIFDGEEYIFDPARDKYFFGSERFAGDYRQGRPKHRYLAAVLLDMIAGKNANFPIEENSLIKAGALVEELWKIAAAQGCGAFKLQNGPALRDDHLALNQAGIPAVDIVDLNYPHWHRLSDLPENCSGESMSQVARVLTVWLQRIK